MTSVLEKHLAQAIDKRVVVFKRRIQDGSILQDEMQLRAVAYLISEIVQPCCCMLCHKDKLAAMLVLTETCKGQQEVITKLAGLVYDDLARCNGLG